LAYINEEVALQAAMLADASDEGLAFTRALDDEATDSVQLQFLVGGFLSALQVLLCDAMCLTLEGAYTNFMVQSFEAAASRCATPQCSRAPAVWVPDSCQGGRLLPSAHGAVREACDCSHRS